MEQIIKTFELVFDNTSSIFEDKTCKFGLCKIQINENIPKTITKIHIVFTIDNSGSMNEKCIDNKTKLEHINHTIKNMLRTFYTFKDCIFSIHVQTFNTIVETIIDNITNIHNIDIEELLNNVKIKNSGSSTNLEIALASANTLIIEHLKNNPDDIVYHMCLTDGEITNGTKNYEDLLLLLPQKCCHIFIGYGIEHDSLLLSRLSQNEENDYKFIDV